MCIRDRCISEWRKKVIAIKSQFSRYNETCVTLQSRPTLTKKSQTRSIRKMLGPFATTSPLTPIHQMSLAVLSRAPSASMSTTTTTTTRDRGDRYGLMEWAQSVNICFYTVTMQQVGSSGLVNRQYSSLAWPVDVTTNICFVHLSVSTTDNARELPFP